MSSNKRGKNYTEKEKSFLLNIVQKYKGIIENKCTNAVSMQRKNEMWNIIAQEFNSLAEAPRTAKQLSTAYFNLKRVTRQDLAKENMQNYIDKTLPDEEVKKLLKDFKKDASTDKKEINKTGGGQYKPVLSEIGAQMMEIMGDQLQPLSNNCDSATCYYGVPEVPEMAIEIDPPTILCDVITVNDIKTPKKTPRKTKKRQLIRKGTLRNRYYLKKLECAVIEKRTRALEMKIALKRSILLDLEIKIKKKQLEDL